MKVLGLDLGDRWVGIAISDGLQMTCRPLKTATVDTAVNELIQIFKQEHIEKIIVGLPTTMRGTSSEQTEKIKQQANSLLQELNTKIKKNIPHEFCDERLSSKRAQSVMIEKNTQKKGDKNKEHSIAAAFILQNYLDAQAFKKATQEDYLS